jgi:FtsP/CotA-like multicopper oxidase with cupredoxin domain
MRPSLLAAVAVLPLAAFPLNGTNANPVLPVVQFHDNVVASGRMVNGEQSLSLEIRRAMWHPYGEQRAGLEMFAFAEAGGRPVMPAPMLRVKVGTRVHVSLANPTDSAFVVHGLQSRRAAEDSIVLAPGGSHEVRFIADAPGTFYYYATFRGQALRTGRFGDAVLSGAYIVDAPGGAPKNEHVVVLSLIFDSRNPDGTANVNTELGVMNGRPWPFTPRLVHDLGDSVRFRFINASNDIHPMHLHGAFFRVESRGVLMSDSVYSAREQRMAVTERLLSGETTSLVWSPERPGGWLLHCHHFGHTGANIPYGAERKTPEERRRQRAVEHATMDPNRHVLDAMGGLMMALEIRPPANWKLKAPTRRQLRLIVPDDSTAGDSARFFTPSVAEGDRLTPPVTREGPGAPLILHQGEPTTIEVVNNSPDPTGIHWHGMELESYYDGVVGVGGTPGQIATAVMPRSTFEARMTPPRAGTFIYHTHLFETRQVARGLLGALVVMPPGQEFDPAYDHLYIMGVTRTNGASLNGLRALPPLQITAGESHRLRFINMTVVSAGLQMHLLAADGTATQWLSVAKDGMDLPAHQRVTRAARQPVSIGETYDFMFTPTAPGRYLLQMRASNGNVRAQQAIEVAARR